MAELGNIDKAAHGAAESPAARVEQVKEHRQKAFSKIEEFPELANEFDNFLTNTKRLHRQQKEAAKEAKASDSEQSKMSD